MDSRYLQQLAYTLNLQLTDDLEAFAIAVEQQERTRCVRIVRDFTAIPLDAIKRGTGVRDRIVILGEDIIKQLRNPTM